jgi:hypothetical protein
VRSLTSIVRIRKILFGYFTLQIRAVSAHSRARPAPTEIGCGAQRVRSGARSLRAAFAHDPLSKLPLREGTKSRMKSFHRGKQLSNRSEF